MRRVILSTLLALTFWVPSQSMAFDPLRENPSRLVLASSQSPSPNTQPAATMMLGAVHPDGSVIEERFEMKRIAAPRGAPAAARSFYGLDPKDFRRLFATRRHIAKWKAEAPGTRGTFSIDLDIKGEVHTRPRVWFSPTGAAPFLEIAGKAPQN